MRTATSSSLDRRDGSFGPESAVSLASSTSQDTVMQIVDQSALPPSTSGSDRTHREPIRVIQRISMTKSNIKPFFGRRDGMEDPEEYLEDIEYAVENEQRHVNSNDRDWNRDRRILFRQNLRDKAELWYSHLSRDLKNDWERLKQEFTTRYQITEIDVAYRRFQISQKVAALSQGPNEHILDYVNRCEELESQAGTMEWFGLNVVQGLADPTLKQQIMYELNKRKDYSFRAAKHIINAAYLSFDSGALQHLGPGLRL